LRAARVATSVSAMSPPIRPFLQHGPDSPASPVILSVPHAGRDYPAALLAMSRLDEQALRPLEDRHADLLIDDAVGAGFTALVASRARAWIDLNRNVREVDPDMIDPPAPRHSVMRSAKVSGGLGLVPRRLRGHGEILRHRLTLGDLDRRIAEDHVPYHARLAALLAATRRRFGIAILLDVHSMPPLPGDVDRPRIVVGDLFGRSAAARFASTLREVARTAGHISAQNIPYAGGHILGAHGAPSRGIHAIQLEIDRGLYLDDALDAPGAGLTASRALVLEMARALADEALGSTAAIAAE
jgi:N-formylglutamate amidohydrolase